MYHGTVRQLQPCYRDKYIPGVGTITVPHGTQAVIRHAYVCEHCGAKYAVLDQAEEDFYCHSTTCKAANLISITPA